MTAEATAIEAILPLAPLQEGLLFHAVYDPRGQDVYTVQLLLDIAGDLVSQRLHEAAVRLLQRHANLRAYFRYQGLEKPVQIILRSVTVPWREVDLSQLEQNRQADEVERLVSVDRARRFDVTVAPLLRFLLIRLGPQTCKLVLTNHHILLDGWSVPLLVRELLSLYETNSDRQVAAVIPYRNYLSWTASQNTAAARAFWADYLCELEGSALLLPAQQVLESEATRNINVEFDVTLTRELTRAAGKYGLTLNTLVQGAWGILLAQLVGRSDVVFGMTAAVRPPDLPGVERMIGLFINTVPVRVKIKATQALAEFLKDLQEQQSMSIEYRHLSLSEIQKLAGKGPLFDTHVVFENYPDSRLVGRSEDKGQLRIAGISVRQATHYSVGLMAVPGRKFRVQVDYRVDLFSHESATQLGARLKRVLETFVTDPHRVVGRLELLGAEERRRILEEWNGAVEPIEARTLPELFEEQVEKSPDAVAVEYEDRRLTYRELNDYANRLSKLLGDRGIGGGDVVAVAIPQSPEMVMAVMGVLKAGAAYLPIDTKYPAERVRFLLEDAGAKLVLSTGDSVDRLVRESEVLRFDLRMLDELGGSDGKARQCIRRPEDAAYVIYTSGTTGKPKGVVVSFGGLANYVRWASQRYEVGSGEGIPLNTPLSFDATVTGLYLPLIGGERLVLLKEEGQMESLSELLGSGRELTLVKMTPAHLKSLEQLLGERASGVRARRFVVGGEALSEAAVGFWRERVPGLRLINEYGPTEAVVGCCIYETPLQESEPKSTDVPIGKPVANTRLYVLGGNLEVVPAGVSGELYIGGGQLARGYLKRAGLTAERFVADPYGGAGGRMYRTGDLVRWRADGNLEFLGRTDHQVKIRGFRVEVGEVEAALRGHEQVQDAVVIAEGEGEEKRLLGYVVRRREAAEQDQAREAQIEQWQQLYEATYGQREMQAGDFDIVGWKSSYTGEMIAAEEMRLWVEETVGRVRELKPRRVLEIGCGTGLLLTRLAGECERYTGVDFSAAVVRQLKAFVEGKPDLGHVEVREGRANELTFAEDDGFDLVILNSVVQYFPDVEYLLDVLEQVVRVTRSGGQIFVGDVRSLPLLEAYHTSVQLYQAEGDVSVGELRQRIQTAMSREEELVVAPALFEELAQRWQKVGRAEVWPKTAGYDNELSRFRYDVVMHLGEKQQLAAPQCWISWDAQGECWKQLSDMLQREAGSSVGLQGIPDRRVTAWVEAARTLAISEARIGEDLGRVLEFGLRHGAGFCWRRCAGEGLCEGVFNPRWERSEGKADVARSEYGRYANAPWQQAGKSTLGRELRQYLIEKLPDYMVPAAVVVMEAFPLTPNGKLDRKALPAPAYVSGMGYREPRTPEEEILCGLFEEVLGLERVGLEDSFFELGGHSLLATRLVSRIRATLEVEMAIRTLFEAPTAGQLSARLREGGRRRAALVPQAHNGQLPLSYAQQRLWFLDRLQGSSVEYNIPGALRLRGVLDVEALEGAINTIVERHESLRTHFEESNGEPVQVIEPRVRMEVPVEDLSGLEEGAREQRVKEMLAGEAGKPFDLGRGPVIRVKLLKLGGQEHILLRTLHHIVSDGWSQSVFNRELMALYEAYREGRENPLPALGVQYADFTVWQRRWLEGGALDEGLKYWKEQLAGIPERLELPTDRPRPAIQTFGAEACQVVLSAEQTQALKRLSRQHQATLYMTLLAGFGVLLSRYSGQDDIVVGSPIANRQDAQLESLIGFFVNSLVMRVRVKPEMSLGEVLKQVRRTALETYQHQDIPFERLVEELSPERNLNMHPVFQVSFAMQNTPWEAQQLQGLAIEAVRGEQQLRVRFDMELHAREQDGKIRLVWLYNRDLFDRWRIEQMAEHYVRVLDAMVADCEEVAVEVELLGAEERRRILEEWNGTVEPIEARTLPELFEEQVEKSPDAVAVVYEDHQVTYRELNERANSFTQYLIDRGIGSEDVVALAMPRSIEMIVGLLGILKAGAAYLPIDTHQHEDRIKRILSDASPAAIATTCEAARFLTVNSSELILDIQEAIDINKGPTASKPIRRKSWTLQSPTYIVYTSGSTGTPKGVIMAGNSLVNLLSWQKSGFGRSAGISVAQLTNIAFDVSAQEILSALTSGKILKIVPDRLRSSPPDLLKWLEEHSINELYAPSLVLGALAEAMSEQNPQQLALGNVAQAGEALSMTRKLQAMFAAPGRQLHNHYGPSETHVVTAFRVPGNQLESSAVPIGKPIWNSRCYVLDQLLQLVPAGVSGELYIAGEGLARGYLRRSALTAERFVADPYGATGGRMYRTGDLARWRADENLEFLGRTDYQVKIRGFRVELGEIEWALREYPGVQDAVVVMREDTSGEKRLIGYVTGGEETIDLRSFRQHLAKKLPDYMVPAAVVVMEAFPLTPNGKLDRKALPAPAYVSGMGYREPRTPEEEILCGLFEEVLGLERVGLEDSFFELGGHSLLATRLVSRIRATLEVEMAIRTLFEAPTAGQLSARLREGGRRRAALVPQAHNGQLPLSYAQQRLWFLDRLQGSSVEYNIPGALRLRGVLDVEALEGAINTIVERHESLRTHFEESNGEPVQVIEPRVRMEVPVEDLSELEEGAREQRVKEMLAEEAGKPFDLGRGPVIRVKLLKLGGQEHILLRTLHHIVSDGWSQSVFNRELMALYEAYREGRENPLPALGVQYADFTVWQRRWLEGGALDEGLKYWKEQLAGIPERLELPTDRPRPAIQTFGAEACQVVLSAEQTQALKRLSQQHQATLYMTLLAGFGVLLSRYSGQDDIVVGSSIANRQDAQLESLIGFFVNSLVMRVRVKPEMSLGEVLKQVRRTALEAYQHQDISFERLVEELSPERNLNMHPVFQVSFAMQNAPWEAQQLQGLAIEAVRGEQQLRVHFDMELHAREQDGKIRLVWLYNRDLFDRWRIEQMAEHYVRVLDAMVADCEEVAVEVELLGAEERRRILEEWNGAVEPIEARTLPELFEEQVEKSPDAVAVEYEDRQVTYRELNERSNRLAHYLRTLGVGPERPVAICTERSLGAVIGLLAVLKAGGAYVPLDPAYPTATLRYMLAESGPLLLLTEEPGEQLLAAANERLQVLELKSVIPLWRGQPQTNLDRAAIGLMPEHLAYMIYTSGSTGRPKSIMIAHRHVSNYVEAMQKKLGLAEGSSYAWVSSFAADLGNTALFCALLHGGRLHILTRTEIGDAQRFAAYCGARRLDCLKITPSHLQALLAAESNHEVIPARCLVFGGEALSGRLLREVHSLRPECRIHNHYGPTECTVGAISEDLSSCAQFSAQGGVPLGRPLKNVRVYILDGRLNPVPEGVSGELYIAGAGVGRGYQGQVRLTAERFVANPFSQTPGERMYRTGDVARWRKDGAVEFFGRTDHQVKIHGFRIELGEVEAMIRKYPGVKDAVVIVREDTADEKRLTAYYTGTDGQNSTPAPDTLRDYIMTRLPLHMVPSVFMKMEAFPLTPNGKLDRKALPAAAYVSGMGYREPRTPEEEILCGLFEEVLGLERVGLEDSFFELGGHSLLATRLVSRIRATLEVEMAIRTLFEAPTAGQLSARLREGGRRRAALVPQAQNGQLPLSYAQQRLWFLDRLQGSSVEYNRPGALRLRGVLDVEALERAINTIVERHESLRTHFEESNGEPVQVIEPRVRMEVPVEDLSELEEGAREQRVKEMLAGEAGKPFDLGRGPVIRVKLLKLGGQEHILLRTLHHIVSDGWSQSVFNRELMALYEAYREGRENPLPALGVQYADFTVWQRRWLEGGALDEGLKYWKEQLTGIPERLELPTDRPRPAIQTFGAEACQVVLSAEQTQALKRLSQQHQATLYMTLLAGFGVLLSRYSGQDDIVVGSPIANRQDAQLESLIGFFVNSLVMRVRVKPEMSLGEVLKQVRRTALEAYQHQDIPFERLVEELSPERNLNMHPVFQVSFAMQNAPWEAQQLQGLAIEAVRGEQQLRVRFDMELHAREQDGKIRLVWLYNRDLFDRWRIEQMAEHYVRVLDAMVADCEEVAVEVELLGAEERRRILEEWNGAVEPIEARTLPELFEEQVEKSPDAVAVEYEDRRLTYRELNDYANRLSKLLGDRGIGGGDVVAVAIPQSPEMVMAVMGVLKAGAAYLPIDTKYPAERVRFLLEDAGAKLVLSTGDSVDRLVRESEVLRFDLRMLDELGGSDGKARQCIRRPEDAAYVIYTSGTTGKPKGVVVSFGGLANYVRWASQRYEVGSGEGIPLNTPLSFDATVTGLYLPLIGGERLVLLKEEGQMESLSELLGSGRELTLVKMTPAHLKSLEQLLGERASGVRARRFVVGGEALSEAAVGFWRERVPGLRLINEYGPTEAVVGCCIYETPLQESEPKSTDVPIGKPVANTRLYVLGGNLEVVPAGVSGELYIGGGQLARGYLKRAGLTAERFVADPYGGAGGRMYRTGDLVRWRADGNLEFLGRTDHQVKIRGFRVEVGEVEAALRGHEQVQDAVVIAEGEGEEKRLLGYVVRRREAAEQDQAREAQIEQWQQLYEATYGQREMLAGDFDIVGWKSSYTGEMIAAEEMRLWVEETVGRVRELKPRRVLEIGCGTGLLLTRLAGECERYTGVDFSAAVVRQLKAFVEGKPDLGHVEVREGRANELTFAEDDGFDLVILNSVVQYFPDVEYLLDVLEQVVRVTRSGGQIFVGDVRSLPLLEAYHTSVQLYQAEGDVSVGELRQRIQTAMSREEELVVAPALFEELAQRWQKVGRAEVWPKTAGYDNELSRFRYDVVMHLGEKQQLAAPQCWISWDAQGECWKQLSDMLQREAGSSVGLQGIPDRRVTAWVEAARTLAISEARIGEDLGRVLEFGLRHGAGFCWRRCAGEGLCEGVFNPRWERSEGKADVARSEYGRYANAPWQQAGKSTLGRELRQYLIEKLPDYMVPAAVVVMEAFPLTPNGKLDRKALPAPAYVSGMGYREPRTPEEEILCGLFEEVLGLERVGLEDSFFELGGHSLLATRLVSRIRATLEVEMAIRTLFEAPTAGQLSARLREGGRRRAALVPQVHNGQLPLSYAQQRLWFLDRLQGSSVEYNIPGALRLRGVLDVEALEGAINTIVERHESLRTHFEESNGEPVQVIEPRVRMEVPVEDLSGLEEGVREQRVKEMLAGEAGKPFDLGRGPVIRVKLLKLGGQEHILLRTLHHIVSDGWSQSVFNRELMALYEAYREGRENPLPALGVQYADFTVWQRRWLEGGALDEGLKYWKEQLAGIPERLELPTDRPRPAIQTFGAEACQVVLSAEQTQALKRLSRQHQATLYMTLLAGFGVLLSRYSGQDDIVVGSPIANRQDAQLESLIGFFVNSLVMRVRVKPEMSLGEVLKQVRRTALETYQHQDIPFERLVEELSPERNLNMHPVFQVSFAMQNAPWEAQQLQGLAIEAVRGEQQLRVRFDMELHAREQDGKIRLVWLYNRDLFDRWRIEQMAEHYVRVLDAMVADCEEVAVEVELLGAEERRRILEEWNGAVEPIEARTLPELFEEQVEKSPDAVAVEYEDRRLTYRELNDYANRLSKLLGDRGIGGGDVVAVAIPQSPEMVMAVMGVLKAGAAYLPIDTKYPAERVRFLLEDAGAKLVLSTGDSVDRLVRESEVLRFDLRMLDELGGSDGKARQCIRRPEDAAYVIYTSGTTGKPKGVVVSFGGLANYVRWASQRYEVGSGEGIPLNTPLSFDATVTGLYLPLIGGERLVLLKEEGQMESLSELLGSGRELTLVKMTPAHLKSLEQLLGERASGVRARRFVVGGEALSEAAVGFWRERVPGLRLINEYGPTEAVVGCCIYETPLQESEPKSTDVPIGKPVANTRLYVLGGNLEVVPAGVSGELYIGGGQLARGYLKRAGLTAERFVADPYGGAGGRMYRTGDLVRWRADGNLEFLGRTDHQVKIRGFRVEVGEVEAALRGHEQVQDAVVIAEGEGEEKRLLGYVVRRREAAEQDQAREAQIEQWQQLYEATYGQREMLAGDFDIVGWKSSYTGEMIAAEEMRLWVEETVGRVRELKPRRVLEIGCGTGLLLTRLAGECERYTGVDFSAAVVRQLKAFVEGKPDLGHVEVREGRANELTFAEDDGFDLVILNSVVQYFPDVEYLLDVLEQVVRVTRSGGQIFVGDVRSLPLLEAYHTSVQLYQAEGDVSVGELRQRIQTAMSREEELVVAPALFEELAQRWQKVGRAEVWPKTAGYDNELSRFRYDVVMHLGEKQQLAAPQCWISWDAESQWQNEVEELVTLASGAVGVRAIPDRRLAPYVEAAGMWRHGRWGVDKVEKFRALCAERTGIGEDLDAVMRFASRLSATVYWKESPTLGLYDAVLRPLWRACTAWKPQPRSYYCRYANTPSHFQEEAAIAKILQADLQEHLPQYMLPAQIMLLRSLPLTRHGKVDLKLLPTPSFRRTAAYQVPRTPQQRAICDLFAEVLGIDRVGVTDNFFDLGGHSLLAIKLLARMRATIGADLGITDLFRDFTPGGIADKLHGDRSDPYGVVIPLSTRGDRAPIFCVHTLGGLSWGYLRLRVSRHPLYGIQARGFRPGDALPNTMSEMVADYIEQIRLIQPSGPYYIVGFSWGGILAHTLASIMQEEGNEVACLAILDNLPSSYQDTYDIPGQAEFEKNLAQFYNIEDPHTCEALARVSTNNLRLSQNFKPHVYHGDLVFFEATVYDTEPRFGPEDWKPYITGDIRVYKVRCRHIDMLAPVHSTYVSEGLEAEIARLNTADGSGKPFQTTTPLAAGAD